MDFRDFKIILFVVLAFSAFVLFNKIFYSGSRNAVSFVFSPAQKFFWQEGGIFSGALEAILNGKKIKIESEELKKQNFILRSENIKLKAAAEENLYLKQALGLGIQEKFRVLEAQFVSKDPEAEAIILNKGEKHGVMKGMPVITKEKVLVGKVEEVFRDFSKVILITGKDFKFSVEVSAKEPEENGIEGRKTLAACRGSGGGLFLELAPKDSEIEPGDIVATSILGGVFPEGFLVGEITNVKKNDPEPFQEGVIKPYFLESDLKILFLLKE